MSNVRLSWNSSTGLSYRSDDARIPLNFVYGLSFRRKRSFCILYFEMSSQVWDALLSDLFGVNFDYEVAVVVGIF